jgi:hypothetical protein
MYKCYRATWAPAGEALDDKHAADERHGTVIGACEREAAVLRARPTPRSTSETRSRAGMKKV